MNSILLLTRMQLAQTFGGARAAIEKRTGANGAMAVTALIALALLGGIGWLGYTAYGIVGSLVRVRHEPGGQAACASDSVINYA